MSAVVISDPFKHGQVAVPAWVTDLATFRRWACSSEMPEQPAFSFLDDEIWVDLSMEQALIHNEAKTACGSVLFLHTKQEKLGYFFGDGMLLSNTEADLSVKPDGVFMTWETIRSRRLRLLPGAAGGVVELEGSPDLVLEVVSDSSVSKDTVKLRDLYWRAGIREYWLVDARPAQPTFQILHHAPDGYGETPTQQDGWLASIVLGREFRLSAEVDPLGNPRFSLEVRPGLPSLPNAIE